MNSGSAASTDYELYANWFPTGVWQGILSGGYVGVMFGQGDEGDYWSSTAIGTTDIYSLYFYDEDVGPGSAYGGRDISFAVRCAI